MSDLLAIILEHISDRVGPLEMKRMKTQAFLDYYAGNPNVQQPIPYELHEKYFIMHRVFVESYSPQPRISMTAVENQSPEMHGSKRDNGSLGDNHPPRLPDDRGDWVDEL